MITNKEVELINESVEKINSGTLFESKDKTLSFGSAVVKNYEGYNVLISLFIKSKENKPFLYGKISKGKGSTEDFNHKLVVSKVNELMKKHSFKKADFKIVEQNGDTFVFHGGPDFAKWIQLD